MRNPGSDRTPLELEYACWRAVIEGRALEVYRHVMASDARVFLPERYFHRREALAEWVTTLEWHQFRFTGERMLPITESITLATYDAVADQADSTVPLRCSSLYVWRESRWQLTLHQRRPLAATTGG